MTFLNANSIWLISWQLQMNSYFSRTFELKCIWNFLSYHLMLDIFQNIPSTFSCHLWFYHFYFCPRCAQLHQMKNIDLSTPSNKQSNGARSGLYRVCKNQIKAPFVDSSVALHCCGARVLLGLFCAWIEGSQGLTKSSHPLL